MKAVQLQMMSVSVKTLSACTRPCLTGWLTSAMLAAQAAEPSPASLENRPRLMPVIIMAPKVPPVNCLKPKAFSMMRANMRGTSWMFTAKMTTAKRI